jgi:hypothetical protein
MRAARDETHIWAVDEAGDAARAQINGGRRAGERPAALPDRLRALGAQPVGAFDEFAFSQR